MLRFSLFALLLGLFSTCSLMAQGNADAYLYVYPNTPDAYPAGGGQPLTNSSMLDSILAQYQVAVYEESFPGAPQSSLISNAHKVSFTGDVMDIYNDLMGTGMFDLIEAVPNYTTQGSSNTFESHGTLDLTSPCANPLLVNDPYPFTPPGNPNFPTRWSVDLMELECAWEITTGNPNIIIGFADTEFDNDHPDLVGKTLPDIEFSPGSEQVSIANCPHGTATMGQAIAIPNNGLFIAGTGYNTRGQGYVVESSNCTNSEGQLWDAIWRAGFTDNHPIVNVSWNGVGFYISNFGTPPFTGLTLNEAVRLIVESGTLLVCGAGNCQQFGVSLTTEYHGAYNEIPGVLIVSGVGLNGNHGTTGFCYYPEVDLCAPGRTLNTVRLGGGGGYTDAGGTSHSAPIVAGIAALCLDVNPCLTPRELEALLKGTTDAIPDVAQHPDTGPGTGTGYVNAYKAVLAASEKLPNTTITGTETWDYPRRVDGTLTIASGAELTITSSVGFGLYSRIVVEPGGKLYVLEGGHLRRDCDNNAYWSGIEVKGNPNATQFSSNGVFQQGYVKLENAIIEDAEIGVSLFRRQSYSQGGGILLADEVQFVNCQKAVAAAKYDKNMLPGSSLLYSNLSYLKNSSFLLDDAYPFSYGGIQVQLDRIRGIQLKDCTIEDNRTSLTQADELTIGIWSSNAVYWVDGTAIKNMLYGIKAENITSAFTFSVTNSEFDNNFYGISARAVDAFNLADNTFTFGGFSGPIPSGFTHPERHTGLFIDQCTGFFVRENRFEAATTLAPQAQPVGIAALNTNVGDSPDVATDYNDIFKNEFVSLYQAQVANGDNQGSSSLSAGGLTYLCNDNQNTLCTDITVFQGSVAEIQRSPDEVAAGNRFTQDNTCNPFSDWDNSSGSFARYFYYDQSSGGIEEPIFFPVGQMDKIVSPQNDCPVFLSPGPVPPGGEVGLMNDFPNRQHAYHSLLHLYRSKLDDGNTTAQKTKLEELTTGGEAALKTDLLDIAPYLSDEVVRLVVDNSVFSLSDKTDILAANPEALQNVQTWEKVLNEGGFTAGQLSTLEQAKATPSVRGDLEADLAAAFARMQRDAQALLHFYLLDESDSGLDWATIRTWNASKESLEGQMALTDTWLAAGDVNGAAQELAGILSLSFDEDQFLEMKAWVRLKEIEAGVILAGRSYDEVTSSELTNIQDLAQITTGRAGVEAQNWLHLLNGQPLNYQAEPEWGQGNNSLQSAAPPAEEILASKRSSSYQVTAFPNPSKGQVQFDCVLPNEMDQRAQLIVRHLTGQVVFQAAVNQNRTTIQWNPGALPAGLYFYELVHPDGQVLLTDRIIFQP